MQFLVPVGTLLTVAGLIGLIACIVMVFRARRQESDDAVLKTRLQKVVVLNLAALAVSGLGLMIVIVGVFLT
jgi:hypothetical protein